MKNLNKIVDNLYSRMGMQVPQVNNSYWSYNTSGITKSVTHLEKHELPKDTLWVIKSQLYEVVVSIDLKYAYIGTDKKLHIGEIPKDKGYVVLGTTTLTASIKEAKNGIKLNVLISGTGGSNNWENQEVTIFNHNRYTFEMTEEIDTASEVQKGQIYIIEEVTESDGKRTVKFKKVPDLSERGG